jgi:carboxylesterase
MVLSMTQHDIPWVLEEAAPFFLKRGRIGCVLIHGFTGSPWALHELGTYLANHNISVSAPLLPGHGTRPENLIRVPWKSWVESSRSEMVRLQQFCDKIFLVGFSMGGTISLLLATQMACSGIVSLSAPIVVQDKRIKLLFLVRPFIRYWKKKSVSSSVSFPEEIVYSRYPLAAVSQFNKLLAYTRERLDEVRCPVLLFHARGDRRVTPQNASWIFEKISSKEKRISLLEDSCHVITRSDDKDRIMKEILTFIQTYS